MNEVLLVTTVVALVIAVVATVIATRLARAERRRATARVAALKAAAGARQPEVEEVPAPTTEVEPIPSRALTTIAVETVTPTRLPQEFLHANPVRQTGTVQRSLALVAATLVVAVAGGLAWNITASRARAVASATESPLELVSLRHDRQSSKLSVSGLVRNPVGGRPVDRLLAVVFLFDDQGTFVTSAKAAVDFLRLGAGDESPFVVSLDAPTNVARYRVSFRTEAGVIPHIDRRSASPVADSPDQPVSVRLK